MHFMNKNATKGGNGDQPKKGRLLWNLLRLVMPRGTRGEEGEGRKNSRLWGGTAGLPLQSGSDRDRGKAEDHGQRDVEGQA